MPSYVITKYCITSDLPELVYNFPQHIVNSDLKPDIILWNNDTKVIKIIELTVPFEACMNEARRRKQGKYYDLVDECRSVGWRTELITLEVGARGFIEKLGFNNLSKLLKISKPNNKKLRQSCISAALIGSYRIWCQWNVQ